MGGFFEDCIEQELQITRLFYLSSNIYCLSVHYRCTFRVRCFDCIGSTTNWLVIVLPKMFWFMGSRNTALNVFEVLPLYRLLNANAVWGLFVRTPNRAMKIKCMDKV